MLASFVNRGILNMRHIEKLIEGSPNERRHLAFMQKRIAEVTTAK